MSPSSDPNTPDPEVNELAAHLADLAAEWQSVPQCENQQDILVAEYHRTFQRMVDLGWSGVLQREAELPDELMPPAPSDAKIE